MCDEPAPMLWFRYNDGNDEGDVLIQDVFVPKIGFTQDTSYVCLQWNSGMDGGGLCGIQNLPGGRNFILSLWDPLTCKDKIKAVYTSPGTKCEPFQGSGTGLSAVNSSLGWEPDCWYTTMVRCSGKNNRSLFEFWVNNQVKQTWTHIATLENPVNNVFFKTTTASYLQDLGNSGINARSVYFQNGFKHTRKDVWMPFSKATFTVSPDKSKYKEKYDCKVTDRTFSLASGGNTTKSHSAVEGKTLEWSMPPKRAADD